MKKIILTLIFFCSTIIIFGQATNQIIYSLREYNKTGDSLQWNVDTINITYLKDNSLITANLVNHLIDLYDIPRTLNPVDAKILINQYFAACNGWSTGAVNNLSVGNNAGSGLNINQINLYVLYFAGQKEYQLKRYELLIRLRHELDARTTVMMDALMGTICMSWSLQTGFIVGKLDSYSWSTGKAFIEMKNGQDGYNYKKVDVYTICPASVVEISKFY